MTKARTVKVESREAYICVHAKKWEEIVPKANTAIAEGYFPLGSISVTSNYHYFQSFIDRDMLVELMADAVRLGSPLVISAP